MARRWAALVVAASVVAACGSSAGRDSSSAPATSAVTTPAPPIGVNRVAAVFGRGVAATTHAIWTTVEPAAGSDRNGVARWGVERRDPRTGSVTQFIPLPGVVRQLAAGAGLVWAIGGGDGAYPQGGVAAIEPATGRVAFTYGWGAGPAIAPYGIAGTANAVWVTDSAGRVLRFSPDAAGISISVSGSITGQPTGIVALSDGSIWVSRSLQGVISRIDATSMRVTETRPWSGVLLAGDGTTIWTTDANRLIQLDPQLLSTGLSVAESVRIPVAPVSVAVDAAGISVGISGGGVNRYGRAALSAALPLPSGQIPTAGSIEPWSLSGQAGDVWFVDDNGLGHWRP